MSAAAVKRFVAAVSVERKCACGATLTVRTHHRTILCAACRAAAVERRRLNAERNAAAAARRAAMTCDDPDCRAPLLTPAEFCNFCIADREGAA